MSFNLTLIKQNKRKKNDNDATSFLQMRHEHVLRPLRPQKLSTKKATKRTQELARKKIMNI